MSGFDLPTAGTSSSATTTSRGWSPHRRGRAGLARTFQHSRSFRGLTVRENVEVAALGVGAGPRAARRRADELLELLGLARYADAPAGSLAHGDERRLGVARALATEPRFVLLDEPAAGLPEAEVPEFAAVVRSVRDDARRRRAADRPQHGARDGGVRPHPGARPGPDARGGHAGGDPRQPRRRRGLPRRERGGRSDRQPCPCSRSTGSRCATAASRPCAGSRLELQRGELVGLIGPNGAGKSTTLHAIMGVVPARGGRRPARRPVAPRPRSRRRSRGRESRSSPRAGGSSPSSRSRRTSASASRRGATERRGERSTGAYELFPILARVPRPAGRRALRRTAAAARDRPRARRRARRAAARRAVARARADGRRHRLRRARGDPRARRHGAARRAARAADGRVRRPHATCSRTASCG